MASLFMALLLWFYVMNQGDVTSGAKNTEVTLQYYNVPAGINVSGPDKVSVRIWGASEASANMVAYVDLAGYDKGVYQVPVKLSEVKGSLFTSVQPKQVEVVLEELSERVIQIKHEIEQNPQEGYNLTQVLLSPDRCLIKGDADVTARVASVVAPVELGNVIDIAMLKPELQARDANGKVITSGLEIVPSSINVYVVVEKKQLSKKVNVVPQYTGVIAEGFIAGDTTTDPVQVTILGDQTKVESINEIMTQPIDITGRTGSFSATVDLVQTEGISVVPTRVNVLVKLVSPPTGNQLP